MDEGLPGNKVNIVGEPNVPAVNENVRRGDYFVLGFIGVLLAGVTAYLMLNPDGSTLRSGMAVEKGNAHKPVHEPVASHALVHEPAKQEPVPSSPPVAEPVESESEVTKPEAAAPAAVVSTPGHENKARASGRVWAVNLVSYSRLDSARKAIAQLKSEGVDTEFIEVTARGHRYYRVRIPNLASRQEAARLYAEFRDRPEYEGAWIAPYRKSAD
ncbi:MAG: SPOR domain-containing protein [Mariprofundus sp.]|nr:SPOR domain-containing protein [Mariprofundus sp.]